jgi:GLPGLI family protein
MTLSQWERSNKKYREAGIAMLSDTLRLKGYLCYKALATLADSTTFTIWYTKELNPLNKEFLPMAGSVPGLILSFETLLGDKKVRYEIDQIVLNPVQQVLFDIPESGYRVLELQHP